MKILADYPDLKTQAALFEKVYTDAKALTEIERSQILSVLKLGFWEVEKVKQRIRRHKFKKWTWGMGGIGVGVLIGVLMI